MSAYKTSKKVRYTVSVIYILIMVFIVGGSYLNQQRHQETAETGFSVE